MTDKSIVLLDGAMGQELVHRANKPATPLWATQALLDAPDLVEGLHLDYLRAGARALTANTYSCTPERLDRVDISARFDELQSLALTLLQQAREKAVDANGVPIDPADITLAGCLPPLFGSYRPDRSPDAETSHRTYSRLVEAQSNVVDIFLAETVSSVADAKIVAEAALTAGKPVWVSLSVEDDLSGNLRSGEPLSAAIELLHKLEVDAVLLNCSQPESIDAAWSILQQSDLPFGAYANGFTSIAALEPGATVDALSARVDLDPAAYAAVALKWVERGAKIIGGCCEIGPAHITELANGLTQAGYTIRSMPSAN